MKYALSIIGFLWKYRRYVIPIVIVLAVVYLVTAFGETVSCYNHFIHAPASGLSSKTLIWNHCRDTHFYFPFSFFP